MTLSRLRKYWLARLAGMVFVTCQTAALAHACSVAHSMAAGMTEHADCHQPAPEDTTDGNAVESVCQHPAGVPSGISVPVAADLPVIVGHVDLLLVASSAAPTAPPLRTKPPPLSLLHCRLRN